MGSDKILRALRASFGRHRVRLKDILKLYKFYSKENKNLLKRFGSMAPICEGSDGLITGKAPAELIAMRTDLEKHFQNESGHKIAPLSDANKKIAIRVFDKNFKKICEEYFGETVVLHNLAACRAVKGLTSSLASDDWHYDLAGNRLKIFVVLKNTEGGVGTELVLGTNTCSRIPHFVCSRRTAKRIQGKYPTKILKHIGEENSFYIFDTNMWHRGDFSESTNLIQSERITIQFDVVTEPKYKLMSELGFPKVGFDVNTVH